MGQFVQPKTYLTGFTTFNVPGITKYLEDTDQTDFLTDMAIAKEKGLSDGEILCSFYAKLCYKSLRVGKNANITKVRSVDSNIKATFDQAHGSVFEHATVNFVTTDCSRVFTHELVRMRAGWAYSQTSGRYCRLDCIDLVYDPILNGCEPFIHEAVRAAEKAVYLIECTKGLRKPPSDFLSVPAEAAYDWSERQMEDFRINEGLQEKVAPINMREAVKWVPNDDLDMVYKKKVTSAARRIAPNGQNNEIGYSINFRALRHFAMLRSGRHAEWEIRLVCNQVIDLLKDKFPLLFYKSKRKMFDGLYEYSGMKMQPYEMDSEGPEAVKLFSTDVLRAELATR